MFGFNCPYCVTSTSEEKSIIQHLKEKHNKTVFPCKICKKLLNRKYNLKRHMNHLHGESKQENLQCPQCEYKTIIKGNLNRHKKINMEKRNINVTFAAKLSIGNKT